MLLQVYRVHFGGGGSTRLQLSNEKSATESVSASLSPTTTDNTHVFTSTHFLQKWRTKHNEESDSFTPPGERAANFPSGRPLQIFQARLTWLQNALGSANLHLNIDTAVAGLKDRPGSEWSYARDSLYGSHGHQPACFQSMRSTHRQHGMKA